MLIIIGACEVRISTSNNNSTDAFTNSFNLLVFKQETDEET